MLLNEHIDIPSPRELLKMTIKKSEWVSKTPLQKYCYLYGIGSYSLSFLGFPVFTENIRLYWYSYVFFAYMIIDAILVMYTGYYYLSRSDLYNFLPCTALLIGPLCSVRYFLLLLLQIFGNLISTTFSELPIGIYMCLKEL